MVIMSGHELDSMPVRPVGHVLVSGVSLHPAMVVGGALRRRVHVRILLPGPKRRSRRTTC